MPSGDSVFCRLNTPMCEFCSYLDAKNCPHTHTRTPPRGVFLSLCLCVCVSLFSWRVHSIEFHWKSLAQLQQSLPMLMARRSLARASPGRRCRHTHTLLELLLTFMYIWIWLDFIEAHWNTYICLMREHMYRINVCRVHIELHKHINGMLFGKKCCLSSVFIAT